MACAWATFLCYGTMMVISYIWGQKSYPVPYAWKKLLAYMVIVVFCTVIHHVMTGIWHSPVLNYTVATLFLLLFGLFIYRVEKKEFDNLFKLRGKPVNMRFRYLEINLSCISNYVAINLLPIFICF